MRYAIAAEEAGFDFEVSSDHHSLWLTEQGHAPYGEAGYTDIALVQIGDEGQGRFLREAAGSLLEKQRAAAP